MCYAGYLVVREYVLRVFRASEGLRTVDHYTWKVASIQIPSTKYSTVRNM